MVKPVQLSNGRIWRTQKEAREHFRAMLNRHSDGQRVTDPQDHSDLAALLTRYDSVKPPGETKTGSGVAFFFRDRDREHPGGTSCFYVQRTDGTSIDFSSIRAVETASR